MKDFRYCPSCAAPLINSAKNKEFRLSCATNCGFVFYDNPTPIVAVVVEYNGKVILAHSPAWPGSYYGLVTGYIEQAEAPEDCAIREVKEELNLESNQATLVGVYPSKQLNQIVIGYHVVAKGKIILNEEFDDYKLLSPQECMTWPTSTGYFFRDWLRLRGVEPHMIEMPNTENI